jgi:hypothetical protein
MKTIFHWFRLGIFARLSEFQNLAFVCFIQPEKSPDVPHRGLTISTKKYMW